MYGALTYCKNFPTSLFSVAHSATFIFYLGQSQVYKLYLSASKQDRKREAALGDVKAKQEEISLVALCLDSLALCFENISRCYISKKI